MAPVRVHMYGRQVSSRVLAHVWLTAHPLGPWCSFPWSPDVQLHWTHLVVCRTSTSSPLHMGKSCYSRESPMKTSEVSLS